MKTTILTCLLVFSGIILQGSTKEEANYLITATDSLHQDFFEGDNIKDVPDSTKGAIPLQWLITIMSINDDLAHIKDTSLFSKYLPRDKTSSYIPQERKGVSYARKIESYFHHISSASTITKDGRYYVLTPEDIKQIFTLYKVWWNKILCCESLDELEKAVSVYPLDNSPYEWKVDRNAL